MLAFLLPKSFLFRGSFFISRTLSRNINISLASVYLTALPSNNSLSSKTLTQHIFSQYLTIVILSNLRSIFALSVHSTSSLLLLYTPCKAKTELHFIHYIRSTQLSFILILASFHVAMSFLSTPTNQKKETSMLVLLLVCSAFFRTPCLTSLHTPKSFKSIIFMSLHIIPYCTVLLKSYQVKIYFASHTESLVFTFYLH